MVKAWGWTFAYRIDQLPSFIWQTWVSRVYTTRGILLFDHPFQANVVMFIVECLVIVGMPVAAGADEASKVFSTENECWAKVKYAYVPPDDIPLFEQEFRSGSIECLLQVLKRIPIPDPRKPPPRCVLRLEYSVGRTIEAYLSATQADGYRTRNIFNRVWLTSEEFLAANGLFGLA